MTSLATDHEQWAEFDPFVDGDDRYAVEVVASSSAAVLSTAVGATEQSVEGHGNAVATATVWAQRLRDDPRVTRSVLLTGLTMATFGKWTAERAYYPIWPARKTIVRSTGLAPDSVTAAQKRLEELGYLDRLNRKGVLSSLKDPTITPDLRATLDRLRAADPRVKVWGLTVPIDQH